MFKQNQMLKKNLHGLVNQIIKGNGFNQDSTLCLNLNLNNFLQLKRYFIVRLFKPAEFNGKKLVFTIKYGENTYKSSQFETIKSEKVKTEL